MTTREAPSDTNVDSRLGNDIGQGFCDLVDLCKVTLKHVFDQLATNPLILPPKKAGAIPIRLIGGPVTLAKVTGIVATTILGV